MREGFVFDEKNDRYTCTAKGVHLPYKKTYQDKKGYYKKQYRSSAKDCAHCPLRTSCIGGRADYKKLEETIDKPLYDQMHERLQTPCARRMKKLRQSTVEPVLGTLINFLGLRRIWTRGLKAANKFMLGAAIAYNLKKWLNHQEPKRKTAVIALKKAEESLCFFVFVLVCFVHPHNRKIKQCFGNYIRVGTRGSKKNKSGKTYGRVERSTKVKRKTMFACCSNFSSGVA